MRGYKTASKCTNTVNEARTRKRLSHSKQPDLVLQGECRAWLQAFFWCYFGGQLVTQAVCRLWTVHTQRQLPTLNFPMVGGWYGCSSALAAIT
jgi:hypothetical protein